LASSSSQNSAAAARSEPAGRSGEGCRGADDVAAELRAAGPEAKKKKTRASRDTRQSNARRKLAAGRRCAAIAVNGGELSASQAFLFLLSFSR
jgi:hypothetical protein